MKKKEHTRISFLSLGAVLGAIGVASGAFGAHALRDLVSSQGLVTWETAARYHLLHALAIVLVGVLESAKGPNVWSRRAGWSLTLGTAVFSGSLYLLVASGYGILGAITPIGGVALITGWLCLARAGIEHRRLG